MITKQEINSIELSPTRKDFYQVWNELVDLVDNLSPIWKLRATNESDPGVVLLKSLVAIADKLSYYNDVNSREVYMPSATQLESMRKLCDMMGYTMHHYKAATGEAIISFRNTEAIKLADLGNGVYIPRFTNLKDTDDTVNYVTLNGITLYDTEPSKKVNIIEGQLVECETNNDNIITINQLDDNHRYFFSEDFVAENGIFVLNVNDNIEDTTWRAVDNLNTVPLGQKVFKFGYDSINNLPYIQFPDDITQLIEDGLRISYIRTNGTNGNIAIKTLSKLMPPSLWKTSDNEYISNLTSDNFAVTNNSSISNGANPEGLDDAYNNYKKTVGTFDTLINCRDYMNKIYKMTRSTIDTTPLVSNIIVSDIRNDINRSHILCSMNDYGICYITEADTTTPGEDYKEAINCFDLILYPFKTIVGTDSKTEYDNSFTYTDENKAQIEEQLEDNKTIAHKIQYPIQDASRKINEITCIKNYLRLKAKITTTGRVSTTEEREILNRLYTAIYHNFNARKIDFGEEIPTPTIEKVILNADSRIKSVNLDEPILYAEINTVNGTPYAIADILDNSIEEGKKSAGRALYNEIILKNVLAGRVSMFKYNTDFRPSYAEKGLTPNGDYPTVLPKKTTPVDEVKIIKSDLDINTSYIGNGVTLDENEVIQFKAPNFKTTITYPAYVNYYFNKVNSPADAKDAIPATFMKLTTFMSSAVPSLLGGNWWTVFANSDGVSDVIVEDTSITSQTDIDNINKTNGAVFTKNTETEKYAYAATFTEGTTYYKACIASNNAIEALAFSKFNTWLKNQIYIGNGIAATEKLSLGLCRNLGTATLNVPHEIGEMVDANNFKYATCIAAKTSLSDYYVQETWPREVPSSKDHTEDGIGADAVYRGVPKNGEYELEDGDLLYINYTKASEDDSDTKTIIKKVYEKGTIIKVNFDLIDSGNYHSGHSYSKKEDLEFDAYPKIEGMFTLGTDQQIEIREPVQVTLDGVITKLYWFLHTDNDKISEQENEREFNRVFGTGNEYTLQDNEYIFYTNTTGTDYNYYGPGTTIKIGSATPKITIKNTTEDVTLAEILTYGLDANIPWATANLSGPNAAITITENMFMSLTAEDKLCAIDFATAGTNQINSNEWKQIKSARYKLSGADEKDLPTLAITDISWQVRSKLDFKSGPNTSQKLSTITFKDGGISGIQKQAKLTVTTKNNRSYEIKADNYQVESVTNPTDDKLSSKSIVFKTNYGIQQTTPELDVEQLIKNYKELIKDYSSEEELARLSMFKLQFNEWALPQIGTTTDGKGATVSLNNVDTTYTRFYFSSENRSIKLNINIPYEITGTLTKSPIKEHGLIALYWKKFNSANSLTVAGLDNTGTKVASLWKYGTQNADLQKTITLESSPNADHVLYLIGITPNCKQLEIKLTVPASVTEIKDNVLFSNLSLIDNINPKLNYQSLADDPDDDGALKQLLTDLAPYQDRFLYNVTPDSNLTIDLNANISSETMSSPAAFYDKNNLANKFTISEIDSNYLKTGITLTKSSKL